MRLHTCHEVERVIAYEEYIAFSYGTNRVRDRDLWPVRQWSFNRRPSLYGLLAYRGCPLVAGVACTE